MPQEVFQNCNIRLWPVLLMFEMKKRNSFINFSQFSTYVKIRGVRRIENNRLDHNQFRLCKEVRVSHEKKNNKTKQTTSAKSNQLKNAPLFGRLYGRVFTTAV